ncbi:biotin-dependent carboxyltransferase [Siminovitchia acidinfaciens]|uniref:Biotin-dependent carboxyltransferase n=1 Tax=Siminovitchia acidinfaciens TaxID=2321395 RepID=A0A429XU47_9BACI|nr:biotin-dependent carboxyltransferase family protein [Siminovitchia acidinfaciens]RST71515.1 biotin-dependent carboxyltransferase [Siminovitchia acidinfaciens]
MIELIQPGIRTTIQDMGRTGFYHQGVPPAGAADKFSFMFGNMLLGNPRHVAALEMMVKGATVEFRKKTTAVVTGAQAKVFLNGIEQPMWTVFEVQKGDLLKVGNIKKGLFSYLCVSGGFDVPDVLGSKSTCLASVFPGITGRLLLAGDEIPLSEPLPGAVQHVGKELIREAIPTFGKTETAHVVLGITCDLIRDEGLVSFLNSHWTIQPQSNRTACRMKGGHISYSDKEPPLGSGGTPGNIVDIPYPIGAVIVPNEEEVIVLLNDGTGGGGFVTIGTIIWSDVSKLSQMRPMSKVRFQAITVDQAISIRREKERLIEKVAASI